MADKNRKQLFTFIEEYEDFLGDILDNTNIIMGDFNFYVEDVKDSENLAFQNLLQSFGLIQHVGCPHINQDIPWI